MTPPTVNAYYNPQMNDINFPAGVLQPPLYDPKMDDAPNYGNTGSTIGHELTHGFDDEGRQFDAQGNLKDWWTAEDAKKFEERVNCIRDQYAQYTIVDDIKINSKLTSGEDVADLGGTLLAYIAWKDATAGATLESKDGFTPDQRFFIGFAQWACNDQRPENLRVNAITNPHSPGRYRVNGIVANLPEFQKAFSCQASQPMGGQNPAAFGETGVRSPITTLPEPAVAESLGAAQPGVPWRTWGSCAVQTRYGVLRSPGAMQPLTGFGWEQGGKWRLPHFRCCAESIST